jgi:hypothetical protein
MDDAPIEPDAPEPSSPRAPRGRRRRRRRGLLAFVLVVAALGALALVYYAIAALVDSGGNSAGNNTAAGTSAPSPAAESTTTTTTTRPPAGPYPLTDGVNVRAGPGTTYPSAGTMTTGTKVLVVCVIDGETINGPKGPTNKWVRITGTPPVGYITNEYVDTGTAIDNPAVIPVCSGTS